MNFKIQTANKTKDPSDENSPRNLKSLYMTHKNFPETPNPISSNSRVIETQNNTGEYSSQPSFNLNNGNQDT